MQIPGTIPIFQDFTVLNVLILETFIISICNPERTNVPCFYFLCRGKLSVLANSHSSFKGL